MNDPLIDDLLGAPPFSLVQEEKERLLVPALRHELQYNVDHCPAVGRLAERQHWDLDRCAGTADFPFIPVTMFKHFELKSVPPEQVVRELRSSSTTGAEPSRIFVDKTTSFRQARALTVILRDFVGNTRRPYLVLDIPDVVKEGADTLTARGAAIRGLTNFASETVFAMRPGEGGAMDLDLEGLKRFFAARRGEEVLVFGFTFMVWKHAVLALEQAGVSFEAPLVRLLHAGGWKKLKEERVSKEEFTARTARVFGCPPSRVMDFYGMVEQVGTVFVDCEAGHKHSPLFADAVIRDPLTLDPVPAGASGLIEVVSALPHSYPGQALMTEDQGMVIGVDDCPCGRRGRYFRFTSRVERAEVRGCGDTYATKEVLR